MKKKFLALVSICYLLIIIILSYRGFLGNLLSKSLQKNLIIALILIVLFIIVIFFDKDYNYLFHYSDLILLLPFLMFILAGNAKLSIDLVKNRHGAFKDKNKIVFETNKKSNIKKKRIISKFDYNVTEESFSLLANYITYSEKPSYYKDKTIKLKGFAVTKDLDVLPKDYFAIGRYIITCCAADAEFGGFMVKKNNFKVEHDKWYDIEGVLKNGYDKEGIKIVYIEIEKIKEIPSDKEKQYAYPCYTFDSTCSIRNNYDLYMPN